MTERHTRSDRPCSGWSRTDGGPRVGRRSYLKLASAAVGSAACLTGAASASATVDTADAMRANATARDSASFSRTVDAAAAGCDPTGERSCDAAFRRTVDDDTLLRFPAGTYRFTRPQVVLGVDSLGVVGEGDVTFQVPSNFNANLLTIAGGSRLVFAGIDVDTTASGATAGLRLCARDRLVVENVTFRGRGTHLPTNHPVANALSPVVRSPEGVGLVRNVVARNDGSMGPAYRHPNGRTGIRVGSATQGTVVIVDCHFRGFPVGGIYASETSGTISVAGGSFRDNDVAGIRLGGAGRIENARIEAGLDDGVSTTGSMDACAIRLEGGGSGAAIESCDLAIGPDAGGDGAIVADHDYGGFTLRDARIRVRGVDSPAVRGFDPRGGRYSPPRGSLGAGFERCSMAVTDGISPVQLTGRPAPRFERCSFDGLARTPDDHATDRDDEAEFGG